MLNILGNTTMTNSQLNAKYFQLLHEEVRDNAKFSIYRTIGSPMVLFSELDGSPLASLHLRCQETDTQRDDNRTRGQALITERQDSDRSSASSQQRFAGLVDRNDQNFELIITNLSRNGFINFDLLWSDKKVTEVNPRGVNEVNELRPFESFAVQSDQATRRSLILSCIKKSADSAAEYMTVEEDEAQAAKDPKEKRGTWFYLSVVPQKSDSEMCKRFARTVWRCADALVLRQMVVTPRPQAAGPWSHRRVRESFVAAERDGARGRRRYADAEAEADEEADMGVGLFGDDLDSDVGIHATTNSFGERRSKAIMPVRTLSLPAGGLSIKKGKRVGVAVRSRGMVRSMEVDGAVDHRTVMESKAATVRGGRTIEVATTETSIEYEYDAPSRPCILGLSVSDKLRFRHVAPDAATLSAQTAKELIDGYVNKRYAEFLATKTYTSSSCCICLDDGPDVVFYACGHQCTHRACAKTLTDCPFCRQSIVAQLDVPPATTAAVAAT